MSVQRLKRVLVGRPIATSLDQHERLSRVTGLALVAIVVTSFQQLILAYPRGGGAYVVTREDLGRYPSLVAGAALLIDYVLTVAVSTVTGIDAITSAIPPLYHLVQ